MRKYVKTKNCRIGFRRVSKRKALEEEDSRPHTAGIREVQGLGEGGEGTTENADSS